MSAPRSAAGQAASLAALAVVVGAVAIYTFGRWTAASAGEDPADVEPEYVAGARLLAHGDGVQLAALEDGFVTSEEYGAAFERFTGCIEAFGATVALEPGNNGRHDTMVITLAPTGDDSPRAAHDTIGTCRSTYLDAVDTAVAMQETAG